MPDNIDLPELAKGDDADGLEDKLQREYELLRDGLGSGITQRMKNPKDLLLGSAVACAGGSTLRLMLDAGGRWGKSAKLLGSGLVLLSAADITRRAVPSGAAILDTWNSKDRMLENKNTVAANLGTALVDYPLMSAAGFAGFKLAGKQPPALASLDHKSIDMLYRPLRFCLST